MLHTQIDKVEFVVDRCHSLVSFKNIKTIEQVNTEITIIEEISHKTESITCRNLTRRTFPECWIYSPCQNSKY